MPNRSPSVERHAHDELVDDGKTTPTQDPNLESSTPVGEDQIEVVSSQRPTEAPRRQQQDRRALTDRPHQGRHIVNRLPLVPSSNRHDPAPVTVGIQLAGELQCHLFSATMVTSADEMEDPHRRGV